MALRSGELSPTEHVTDVLDRLAADPHNAVITLDAERALAQAAALTAELARGRCRGPLHGVALGVKDLIDVAGLPTRAGSHVLADAPPAAADAPVVARLRAAGAVVVAKLHTHEFAYGPTGDVAATGPARNPHDPSRITGGSSSGSAAAVAAGHLPLALGTDTGASVRTPAALCGVVGLKPTLGRAAHRRRVPALRDLRPRRPAHRRRGLRRAGLGRAVRPGRHRRRRSRPPGRRAAGRGADRRLLAGRRPGAHARPSRTRSSALAARRARRSSSCAHR